MSLQWQETQLDNVGQGFQTRVPTTTKCYCFMNLFLLKFPHLKQAMTTLNHCTPSHAWPLWMYRLTGGANSSIFHFLGPVFGVSHYSQLFVPWFAKSDGLKIFDVQKISKFCGQGELQALPGAFPSLGWIFPALPACLQIRGVPALEHLWGLLWTVSYTNSHASYLFLYYFTISSLKILFQMINININRKSNQFTHKW